MGAPYRAKSPGARTSSRTPTAPTEGSTGSGARIALGRRMFAIDVAKILEIVARVAIIYIGCMVLLRVSNRREMSGLGPMDLLTMLLLSETVSPALTGGDDTITGGMTAAIVLLGMTAITSYLTFRSRKFEQVVQGTAVVLIRDGVVAPSVLRRYRITADDLQNSLHKKGLMSVREVARAFVEPDGAITFIRKADHDEAIAEAHGHLPPQAQAVVDSLHRR